MQQHPYNPTPHSNKFWSGIPIFSRPGRKTVTVQEGKNRRLADKNRRRRAAGLEPLTDYVEA